MNEKDLRPYHARANWIASEARRNVDTLNAQIRNVQSPPAQRLVPNHARGRQELGQKQQEQINQLEQRIEDVKDKAGKEITRVVDALPPHATVDDKRQVVHTANAILEGNVPPLQKNPINYMDKGGLSLDFNLQSGNRRGGSDPSPGPGGPNGGNNPPPPPPGGGQPGGRDDNGPPDGGGGGGAAPPSPTPPAETSRASRFVEGLRGYQEGQKDQNQPEQGKEQPRTVYSRFLGRDVPVAPPDKQNAGTIDKSDPAPEQGQAGSQYSRFAGSLHGVRNASPSQETPAQDRNPPKPPPDKDDR